MSLVCRRERFLSFLSIILLRLCNSKVTAFLVHQVRPAARTRPLYMGLYDKPLPARPPPLNNDKDNDNDDDDDEDDIIQVSSQLFQLDVNGKEVNNLLPPLGRRLDRGIQCYFEPNDKLVQNLVDKTSCSVEDACWALEACKGDLTEAWTRVSVARRNQLERERGEDDDASDDSLLEKEYKKKKQARLAKEQTRERLERMKRTKPDTDWLPIQNPKPMDDEPWFTG